MKTTLFILTILGLWTSCSNSTTNSRQISSIDSFPKGSRDTVPEQTLNATTDTFQIPETHLHDTTIVSGNFILFLRPDSVRFDSYTQDPNSRIYEVDSDFGVGIEGTMDSIPKYKKYKRIKVLVSENRYIIIKDCKNGPLTIDRDSVDYGIILSGKGRQIEMKYESIHSYYYLPEIDEYFNIK